MFKPVLSLSLCLAITPVALISQPVSSVAAPLNPSQIRLNTQGFFQRSRPQAKPATPYSPDEPAELNGEPAHVEVLFNKPANSVGFTEPKVVIYPIDAYRQLYKGEQLKAFNQRINTLKSLLAKRPATVNDSIPVLPDIESDQVIRAQIKYLNFSGGSGVRFLTHYSFDVSPITNQGLFYTFQGLTNDGKYYVAVYYPISAQNLPNDPEVVIQGDYDAFGRNFSSYMQRTIRNLNQLPATDYNPNLINLDQMVQSISI